MKINMYELKDGVIIHYLSRRCTESITLVDIISWSVEYEMIFDLVTIDLKDGSGRIWMDEYNDLLTILCTHLSHIEKHVERGPD